MFDFCQVPVNILPCYIIYIFMNSILKVLPLLTTLTHATEQQLDQRELEQFVFDQQSRVNATSQRIATVLAKCDGVPNERGNLVFEHDFPVSITLFPKQIDIPCHVKYAYKPKEGLLLSTHAECRSDHNTVVFCDGFSRNLESYSFGNFSFDDDRIYAIFADSATGLEGNKFGTYSFALSQEADFYMDLKKPEGSVQNDTHNAFSLYFAITDAAIENLESNCVASQRHE